MAKKFTSTDYRPKHEEIARRAQQIYLANGSQEGKDVENWLQAEAQLLSEHQQKTSTTSSESAKPTARPARSRA